MTCTPSYAAVLGGGASLPDYVLRELVEVASRPEVSDILRRAAQRSGGATTADIVDAVRQGRDRGDAA